MSRAEATAEVLARISPTRGPWFVVQAGDRTFEVRAPDDSGDLFADGGLVIADRLAEPDARLIAAAPSLYEGGRAAFALLVRICGQRPLLPGDRRALELVRTGLDAALV